LKPNINSVILNEIASFYKPYYWPWPQKQAKPLLFIRIRCTFAPRKKWRTCDLTVKSYVN